MKSSDQRPRDMSDLGKTVKSAGVAYVGAALVLGLGFLSKVIAVRQTSVAVFGMYTSAVSTLSIMLSITQLGMQDGIARFVALHYGSNRPGQAAAIIRSGLIVGLVASLAGLVVLLVSSNAIASQVLKASEVANQLWMLWAALPFWVFTNLVAAFFQGLGRVEFRALIVDGSRLTTFIMLVLILPVFWRGQSFLLLIGSFSAGVLVSNGFALWGIFRNGPWPQAETKAISGELLRFSIPLVPTSLLSLMVASGNALILGYLSGPNEVAYYSTVVSVALCVIIGGGAFDLALLPTFTRMKAQGRQDNIEGVYWTLTRWSLLLTTPVAFVLFCFPETFLNLFFGPAYVVAAPALRVATMGCFLHVAFGPNEAALKMLGNSGLVLATRIGMVVCMVVLGWLLTLQIGFTGMIIGWGFGLAVYNVLIWLFLYQRCVLTVIPHSVLFTYLATSLSILLPGLFFQYISFLPRLAISAFIFAGIFGSALLMLARRATEEDQALMRWFARQVRLVPGLKNLGL